jgi:hypothetical protein
MTLPVFIICAALALLMSCAAGYFYCAYAKDSRRLKALALQLTAGTSTASEKVRAINSFVYGNHGFGRNRDYYLLESLGATPVQVLERGGDCTDKSRLLAAMLDQIGIKASMAMLYARREGKAIHTVVLAETECGVIAADPIYDLMFPGEGGGYHDVRAMIRDPEILERRLSVLRAERGPQERIGFYDEANYHYGFVTTANWRKYRWLEALARALAALGLEPRLIRRPALLENPKLSLAWLSGAAAALFALLAFLS